MARNGVLGFLTCPCFAWTKEETQAPLSDSVNVSLSAPLQGTGQGTASSASTSAPLQGTAPSASTVQQVPSCRLVPLPRQRDYPSNAVGIDDQVNGVIRHLEWENETKVAVAVILHGLGGTGKTILANAVVAKLDIEGWNYSTVVPPGSTRNLEDCQGEIQEKQAFIYIDNHMVLGEHLQKLLRDESSKKKLRLLLTARDETIADVLSACGINTHVYHVRPLYSDDARKLLCHKMGVADTMQTPQIDEILKICDGVPLVLERVGEYICSQSQDKDEAFSRAIEEYIIEHNGLLFDLDELRQASAMETFLDICSFFNGWDWDKVSCIMGEDKLNTLRKRALLLKKEECENYKVSVRHIVLMIGSRMAQGERFTNVHELSKALEGNDQAIGRISGIWLQDNISEPVLISAKKLDLMHNSLRVLALGDMAIVVDGQCTKKFKQIRYFQAGLIPYIPFHPTTSQGLRLLDWLPHNNNDLQLTQMSSKLAVLNLYGARYDSRFEIGNVFVRLRGLRCLKLTEFKTVNILPEELSSLTLLEELDLSECRKLVELPKDLGNLKVLAKLSLRSCGSLKYLPDSFGKLRSLKYLDLHSCVALKELPEDFGSLSSLEELDLGSGYLKELPSTFEQLCSLKVLILNHCGILNHLPNNMGNLSALTRIEFEGSHLRSIPPSFQRLNHLPESVKMAKCSHLTDLPEEFCSYLKLVKDLSFRLCPSLKSLPKRLVELASLRRLDLHYCKSLESLPEGFGQLTSLVELNLKECHSLQELSTDFYCLKSLQSLNIQWCRKLEGKWMDSIAKIETLDLVDIVGSRLLLKRWKEMEMEMENGGESWHFAVRTGRKKWKLVDNILNKAASKFFDGVCLLKDSGGNPFCISTVAPNTVLLVMYEHDKDLLGGPWRLLEDIVKHDDPPIPFQMIYVGKYFRELSKKFADRITAYASEESDAHLLFYEILEVTKTLADQSCEVAVDLSSHLLSSFLVTKVVADEDGWKHFSTWEDITRSCVGFFLSNSKLYSRLEKLTESPQETNDKLLRELFETAESGTSSIFLRNYTENIGVAQLCGKTVLLLISFMDEHPFESLRDIYSKINTNDDLEILSIPIPIEVRGQSAQRSQQQVATLPDSDLAGFESILRNVPWPVLRNPWLLKTEVYYFFEKMWGKLNPAMLVVMDPKGRVCHKNALSLVQRWGSEVYPITEESIKHLEQVTLEDHVSEPILNALFEKWSN